MRGGVCWLGGGGRGRDWAHREEELIQHEHRLPVMLEEGLLCHVLLDDCMQDINVGPQDICHCELLVRRGTNCQARG